MFSMEEKRKIADEIQKLLLDLDHPEMPTEKPSFKLHVNGKEAWSWADIEPNWIFDEGKQISSKPWNEHARDVMGKKDSK